MIVSVKNIAPKTIRKVIPVRYKNKEYVKLDKNDIVTLTDCVFSVYPARDKDTGTEIIYEHGERKGQNVTNITVYLGFDDGRFTSVNNDTAVTQIAMLVNFNADDAESGYYDFTFAPEKVKVVSIDVKDKKGNVKYPSIAFEPA